MRSPIALVAHLAGLSGLMGLSGLVGVVGLTCFCAVASAQPQGQQSAVEDPRAAPVYVGFLSRTIYHGFQLQLQPELANNDALRQINRFAQTIDGRASGWGPGGKLEVVLSLRYDTDFGTGFRRDTPDTAGIPAVDGRNDFDLQQAYLRWRDLFGRADLTAGRQLIVDDLNWYALDGLATDVKLYRDGENQIEVGAYFGIPVRFDALFSSEPFLADGTETDDGRSFPHALAFGASARANFFSSLRASVSYRQEVGLRDDPLVAFGGAVASASRSAGTLGLRESRIGGTLGYTIRPARIDLFASAQWDALLGQLEQARASAAWDPWAGVHVQAEYLRVRPRFIGDSIFNYFNIIPYDRGRLELDLELVRGLVLEGGYVMQHFGGETVTSDGGNVASPRAVTTEAYPDSDWLHGPSIGLRYTRPHLSTGAHFEASTNSGGQYAFGGNYRMGWVFGRVDVLEGRLAGNVRLSFTTHQTDWFAGRNNGDVADPDTTFITHAGLSAKPLPWLNIRTWFAKNFGSSIAGGYRVYSEVGVRY